MKISLFTRKLVKIGKTSGSGRETSIVRYHKKIGHGGNGREFSWNFPLFTWKTCKILTYTISSCIEYCFTTFPLKIFETINLWNFNDLFVFLPNLMKKLLSTFHLFLGFLEFSLVLSGFTSFLHNEWKMK